MIFLCAYKNPYQNSFPEILGGLKKYLSCYKDISSQVVVLLHEEAEDLLRQTEGLQDFRYLFMMRSNFFSQIQELRNEMVADSLVVEDLHLDPRLSLHFYQKCSELAHKTDFVRPQKGDKILGIYYATKNFHRKIWLLSDTRGLNAGHFSWQSIPIKESFLPSPKAVKALKEGESL